MKKTKRKNNRARIKQEKEGKFGQNRVIKVWCGSKKGKGREKRGREKFTTK